MGWLHLAYLDRLRLAESYRNQDCAEVKDPRRNAYMSAVLDQLLGDLQHPVGKDGTTVYAEGFKAVIAWHLVRAGWRKPNNTDGLALREEYDDPVIKKRKVHGPGVFEDAVEWIDFHEPDDPLANLAAMTMGEIDALPEHLRVEAKRRLGLIPNLPTDSTPNFGVQPWSVKTDITITDEPEEG